MPVAGTQVRAQHHVVVASLGAFAEPLEVLVESGFDDAGYRPERWRLKLDCTQLEN